MGAVVSTPEYMGLPGHGLPAFFEDEQQRMFFLMLQPGALMVAGTVRRCPHLYLYSFSSFSGLCTALRGQGLVPECLDHTKCGKGLRHMSELEGKLSPHFGVLRPCGVEGL